jgi:hypothetical protein
LAIRFREAPWLFAFARRQEDSQVSLVTSVGHVGVREERLCINRPKPACPERLGQTRVKAGLAGRDL